MASWQHRIVGQSILDGTPLMAMMGKSPIDPTSIEGAANMPYAIPEPDVDLHTTKLGVPIQWWRSVGSTHNAFATECFLDDIARATKKDPVELRRSLLANHPHHLAVLNLAARRPAGAPAGQGTRPWRRRARVFRHRSRPGGRGRAGRQGVQGGPRGLRRHCGRAINPNIVAMQMESGIG